MSGGKLSRSSGLSEHAAHDRMEGLDRQRVVRGVEAVLVVELAKLGAVVEPPVAAIALAGVRMLLR
jgi:DNA-binding Lrp family transcriptional regulator